MKEKINTKGKRVDSYVLLAMVVTLETTHLERSLVNTPALKNAVKIIQQQIYKRKRTKFQKRKRKLKKCYRLFFIINLKE